MICDPIPTGLPHVQGGRVGPLAVTTPQCHPALPDVPTFAEAGVPGYEAVSYYGFFAPARVPASALAVLRAAVEKALAQPDVVRRLDEQGVSGAHPPMNSPPMSRATGPAGAR
jgi:tripartite-type tricarboxylate transporter receptor subunit TctC